jgi:hypothetical protein
MKSTINHILSCCWIGAALALGSALPAKASTEVTFQVDMSSVTSEVTNVFIMGTFNGWGNPGSPALTNNGSDIYIGTVTITDSPGTVESCKFFYNPGGNWEGINNRQFVLGSGTQVLPLEEWNTNDWPTPTNFITFQVDMSAQVDLGNFTNGDPNASITVSGDFEGWNGGLVMTNNATLTGNASNVYTAVCPVVAFLPDTINYKFRMNGGWESPASTSGNNRQSTITTANQVLPLVFYNDASVYDLVLSPITVSFTLYMPDGTMDDNGYAYNSASDTLWINGDFLNNWDGDSWPGPVGSFPSGQQMIEVGTSAYYTNSFVVPRGNGIALTYKYSIDSQDNENGFATNHIRYIRSYGPTYNMPTDQWSWSVLQPGVAPYPNPGITSTNIVEPDFGYLTISAASGGAYPITWLGRPGVVLESSTNLSSGWNAIGATDATQATNWPATSGNGFFRLMKKQ